MISPYRNQSQWPDQMRDPREWSSVQVVPQSRVQLSTLVGGYSAAIHLVEKVDEGKKLRKDYGEGSYEVANWPEIFTAKLRKTELSEDEKARVQQEVDAAMTSVVTALTVKSSEGTEAVPKADWARFLQGENRWAARWTEEGQRELIAGTRREGVLRGTHLLVKRVETNEHIVKVSFGQLKMDGEGSVSLQAGVGIDHTGQPAGTYLERFLADGVNVTQQGRHIFTIS